MRWLATWIVLLFAARVSAANPASNPAFLGIEMSDFGAGCSVNQVTNCSPAQDAGLRFGDFIMSMDGKPLVDISRPGNLQPPACTVLRDQILQHAPGDVVTYEVLRGSARVTVKVSLSTRADVQHRCFVGQQMPSIETVDIDDHTHDANLDELRGKTSVVAWFDIEHCAGCAPVFDRIADGIGGKATLIGVTPVVKGTELPKRHGFIPSLRVLVADQKDFREITLNETQRIQVMVVDCHGVIQFVAPLAPGSEDLDAAIDEVLAAVEQAEHQRTQRR